MGSTALSRPSSSKGHASGDHFFCLFLSLFVTYLSWEVANLGHRETTSINLNSSSVAIGSTYAMEMILNQNLI